MKMIDIRERIEREEDLFPMTFTNYIEKDYGVLFFNEQNKESYDSNHALLYESKVVDLDRTLHEITKFYKGKGIKPSIYQATGDKDFFMENKELFKKNNYDVWTKEELDFMVLTEANCITSSLELDIKMISEWDERIATDICIPCNEEYEIQVIKDSIKSKEEIVFVGYKENRAVAITYFHLSRYNVCRFDYILVNPDERGKGYGKDMVHHIVEYCKKNHIPSPYAWPAHEISASILYKAGFRPLFNVDVARASYNK